jgi:hypothetical protein
MTIGGVEGVSVNTEAQARKEAFPRLAQMAIPAPGPFGAAATVLGPGSPLNKYWVDQTIKGYGGAFKAAEELFQALHPPSLEEKLPGFSTATPSKPGGFTPAQPVGREDTVRDLEGGIPPDRLAGREDPMKGLEGGISPDDLRGVRPLGEGFRSADLPSGAWIHPATSHEDKEKLQKLKDELARRPANPDNAALHEINQKRLGAKIKELEAKLKKESE